ncbi:MAG: GNAT family N-acetyltransferase [Acidobacteria bacterium]|nr:GNAT family N-acetyltransferase [Acidobacteriota bacterium]NIM62292.1 GNAT family N-acetyltransferase [Acidobacteriota bacterium]NIO59846.1 GNAT family N-acetyltransferase [Acidobacteriota bacterium]NIQ30931.1 GNAT family N-acetyltransferase [Acidobacteriota bacterium]NIQ86005.1 GNAT family N-acetyltransferase [Acidobacteriota bacterium]
MASYRFCRSDDVPLLVDAYNACFRPPGGAEPIDRERFKWWIRVLELWTSSCMVATEGDRLIGVVLAAKRENAGENCVLAVGVHPDFRGLGHGRHMVTSLGQKLAILGPPRILVEVPADNERFRTFLGHCGYEDRESFTDYVLERTTAASAVPAEMVATISLEELAEARFPERGAELPWGRTRDSIARRQEYFESVRAVALAGADRFEAALLVDESTPDKREILAIYYADEDAGPALTGGLLRHYASLADTPLHWERVHESECSAQQAVDWGFRSAANTVRMATTAIPA